MSSKGFKIDSNFDIVVENGLFSFVRDINEVAQRAKHELLTFLGEVVTDPERGLDVLGIILSETATKAQRKDEIRRVISYIPELTINNLVEEIDGRAVRYYISVQYQDINDTITFEVQ